jgi:hypothetical protein
MQSFQATRWIAMHDLFTQVVAGRHKKTPADGAGVSARGGTESWEESLEIAYHPIVKFLLRSQER